MGAKRNLANSFDAIERGSCSAIQAVADLHIFRRLSRALRGLIDDSSMIRPEPWELVRAIATHARRTAVAWTSDDFGYPSAFSVSIAREAWECFYQHDTRDIARRIASEVRGRIAQPFQPEPRLTVTISCDSLLYRGDFDITASFDDQGSADEDFGRRSTVVLGDERDSRKDGSGAVFGGAYADGAPVTPRGGTVVRGAATYEPETASHAGWTSIATVLEGADAPAGRMEAPHALLRFGDESFELVDGATIGAPGHARNADIELPIGANRHVSGRHGRFERTATGWTYEQLGPNGSTLIQNGSATGLRPGSKTALEHGAVLELPHVEERLVFELVP